MGAAMPEPATLVCPKTGLRLVSLPERSSYRVQKISYGAMNPMQRVGKAGADPAEWGRWDCKGGRTIYASSTAAGAYMETLSWAQQKHGAPTLASALFDDEVDSEATLMDLVEEDFKAGGWMSRGSIPRSWREQRHLYTLALPPGGWFVDVSAAATLAVLNEKLPRLLEAQGVDALKAGDLFGADRVLTTGVAKYIHGRVLSDGSLPHGIRYQSKHGTDHECYATWLRAVDDGKDVSSEPTRVVGEQEILACDADLWTAANMLGLVVH